MLPDAECVKILSEILNTLDLGQYVIKLNHRQLLDGILEVCGVPAEKSPSICSAIDSLDKVAAAVRALTYISLIFLFFSFPGRLFAQK